MTSLLDRLKRGLRELRQNPRDHARTQIDRAGDRRDGDAAPQHRSESEAAGQKPGDKFPPQQPVPPASTRLKKAVLSKARRAAAPRQAATIWGAATTAAAQGNSWLGAPAAEQPTLFTGASLAGVDPDPKPSVNAAPASSHGFFAAAAHHAAPAPAHDHSLWSPPATATPPAPPAFGGAPTEAQQTPPSLLDGAPSFGRSDDVAPPSDRLF